MDFIEAWWGISPDGGSGATEVLFLMVPVTVVALVMAVRYRKRRDREALAPIRKA